MSNVVSRAGFLQTLEDTLGFVPKVDFNAGASVSNLFSNYSYYSYHHYY